MGGRIVHTANVRHSQSKRARGKLRAILNANKRAAAAETAALAKKTRFQLSMLRAQQARLRRAAKDLSAATRRLRHKMQQDSRAQNAIVAGQRAALRGAAAAAKSALKAAKSEFSSKLNTMVNRVAANAKKFESGLKRVTGVAHSWAKNSAQTRTLMKENIRTMNTDLSRALARSVELGQKRARRNEAIGKKNVNKMI